MLRQHYTITTDVARVYKVKERGRTGWGWAIATIREWPRGGQIDVQSDFGNFAYSWSAVGDRTLREFLCNVGFDYFMNKAAGKWRTFDEEATIRAIKKDIFAAVKYRHFTREQAIEYRDELDGCGDTGSEHLFVERLMSCDWFSELYDTYPSIVMRDSAQAREFWDGPWKALCEHWRKETEREKQPRPSTHDMKLAWG